MKVAYSADAEKDLEKLTKPTAKRILDKIDFYAAQEDPLSFAKTLQGKRNLYRFRIGWYRAIFTLEKGKVVILVLAVKDRKEAYR